MVGADGTRSAVRAALGIATTNLGTWAHAVQVLFRPDAPLRPDPPLLLTFVDEPHPGAMLPMGEGRWVYAALRFDGSPPDIPDNWTATLRAATGSPDLAPEVLDVQRFTLAAEVATTYRAGPGFLVGDAAHRTTPVAGIGLNTAIHDGHELGWKLAWAARGLAGDALLASHDAERGPVGLAAAARSLDVQGRPTDGLPSALGHTHRSPVIAGTEPAPDLRIDLTARPGSAHRTPGSGTRAATARRSTCSTAPSPCSRARTGGRGHAPRPPSPGCRSRCSSTAATSTASRWPRGTGCVRAPRCSCAPTAGSPGGTTAPAPTGSQR